MIVTGRDTFDFLNMPVGYSGGRFIRIRYLSHRGSVQTACTEFWAIYPLPLFRHFNLIPPPCCCHKGQIVTCTMFYEGRLTFILFFQVNSSYINKPFRKMPKNSNFLIRLETGCIVCLHQVYTKENKRNITWY